LFFKFSNFKIRSGYDKSCAQRVKKALAGIAAAQRALPDPEPAFFSKNFEFGVVPAGAPSL
jgi:hypothetical protein